MVRIYTLPLFALRPTYLALRSFKKALNDVIMSRRAINNMNNLYPDVTAEELAATDNVCIICREEMTGGAKKLPCNHIFHVSCLRSWFQRQQTCPTCRLNVLRVPPPAAAAAARNFQPFNQFAAFGQGGGFRGAAPAAAQAPFGIGMWGGLPAWAQQPAPQQGNNPAPEGEAAVGGAEGAAAPPPAGGSGQGTAENTGGQVPGPNPEVPGGARPFQFPFGPFPPFGYPQMRTESTGTQNRQFGVPPMPYIPLVPPPPPLLNTTGLSDEELRRMEGTSREHIEARLQCLRNVQILLDSAVVQMQQYATVVTNVNTNAATEGESAQKEPQPGTSQGMEGSSPDVELSETAGSSVPGPSRSSDSSTRGMPLSEQDELRRRRLQKFSNATTAPAEDTQANA